MRPAFSVEVFAARYLPDLQAAAVEIVDPGVALRALTGFRIVDTAAGRKFTECPLCVRTFHNRSLRERAQNQTPTRRGERTSRRDYERRPHCSFPNEKRPLKYQENFAGKGRLSCPDPFRPSHNRSGSVGDAP